jgi:hypothetical protein
MKTIDDCRIIELPKIRRVEGNITFVEGGSSVTFDIARIYYLYDIPGGESRGGHAHKELEQLIVSVIGSFDVVVDDGCRRKTIVLNRAYYGLYVPKLIWRELTNFSSGGICVVLASQCYDEQDYIRDYQEFLKARRVGVGVGH